MVTVDVLTEQLNSAKEAWDKFTVDIGNFSLDSVISKFKNFAGEMNKSLSTLNATVAGNDKMAQSFDKVASGLGKILTLSTNFDAFKNLSVQGGHSASTMSEQFDMLVQRFGSFEKAAEQLAGKVGKPFQAALNGGEAATKAYLQHVASAEALENAYLSLQGATGNLGKEFKDLAGLDARLAQFNVLLQDAAGASNKTLGEVSKYAAELGTIPGAITQVVSTQQGFDRSLNGLTATLRLAAGSGRGVSEVIDAMGTAYEKLGNPQGTVNDNAAKGAQLFSLMSEASQKLNLRFTDTKGYLTHVADSFKMIGDNTEAATNILSRFTGALQGTGLTAKQSIEVVTHMVDALKSLEMGTKALISQRAGGPGGLQGAFQVENLLRQGKVDEVAKMMEQTLRQQFRGRIYTQEEAARSPQAAAQFMRQRTMLRSGAFGALANSDESATRLLEALKAGPGSAGPTINALMAVKNTATQGNQIQERQANALHMLNGGMDRLVSINEAQFKINARQAIGTASETEFADALKQYRSMVDQQGLAESGGREPKAFDTYLKEQNMQGAGTFLSGFEALPNVAGMVADGIKDASTSVVEIARDAMDAVKQEREKRDIAKDIAHANRVTAPMDNRHMHLAAANAMRQPPATLAARVPRPQEVTKHEVAVKPLEVKIQVSKDQDTQVTTTTNYPNATVQISNSAAKGYNNIVK